MVATNVPAVVADAGPLIHLDELGCLDLLQDFSPLVVPRQVTREFRAHRPVTPIPAWVAVAQAPPPSPRLATLAAALALDAGELEAISLLQAINGSLLLCDDSAARLAAESLDLRVHGTIGILLRSARRELRTKEQVLTLLSDLPLKSTLHLSKDLLQRAIDALKQEK